MTDNTQPEAGSTHIIRYALELGLLWVDGSGRDKVREALDALDAIEAKLASIGAARAPALSAAPAGVNVTAPAVASEPIAYLYDDGSWTPAKTEEGRKLNDWMISAGSPKIGVHLASTAQPTPLTTLAQATQAGNQQEARPCHVFTVRKAGGLTEWEPTTMALALPDGAHALYTLPQPSPHAHADSVTAPMRQGKWTWVPVEPSTAMLVAGNHGRPGDFSALKVWQDMIAALDRSADYTRPIDPPFVTIEPVGTPLGMYEHKCQNVTGHRGPSFVCQKTGQAVSQNSYCNNCPKAAPQPAPAELEQLRERISRMGLDVDRAMRGNVNEQSPLGTQRLAAIAALAKPAPAPLSGDVVQKTWALLDELEKLRGADRYDEDWDTLNKRDSELRAALAAQGGI